MDVCLHHVEAIVHKQYFFPDFVSVRSEER